MVSLFVLDSGDIKFILETSNAYSKFSWGGKPLLATATFTHTKIIKYVLVI